MAKKELASSPKKVTGVAGRLKMSPELQALHARRKQSKKKGQIDDTKLYAGSSMHYYCKHCGLLAQTLYECDFFTPIRDACGECQKLIDAGIPIPPWPSSS